MDELRNAQYEKVLIVAHGGIIRLMWCYLLQIPIKNAFKIPVNYGEIFQFNLGKTNEEDFYFEERIDYKHFIFSNDFHSCSIFVIRIALSN